MEAAWSYRHRPGIGIELRRRSEGQPSEVTAYAWAAQCRLCTRFRQLAARRDHNMAVAVARELAGFVWGMMTRPVGSVLMQPWERAGVHRGRILADVMGLQTRVLSQRQLPTNR